MGEEGNGTELGGEGGTSDRGVTDEVSEVFVRATFSFVTQTVGALFLSRGSLKETFGKRGAFVLLNKGCRLGVGAWTRFMMSEARRELEGEHKQERDVEQVVANDDQRSSSYKNKPGSADAIKYGINPVTTLTM